MKFKKAKRLFDEYHDKWKDHHVFAHGMRVMRYATKVCEELGLSIHESTVIELAAKYHDIGKIMYPPRMHEQNRKFTKRDIKIFKKHVKYGYDILKGFYGDDSIAKLVLYHHEKIDGSGYLKGLKGEDIPLGSRIITVCDAYDAMFRHYCQKTGEEAIQELKRGKGTHFDETVVGVFLEVLGAENGNSP